MAKQTRKERALQQAKPNSLVEETNVSTTRIAPRQNAATPQKVVKSGAMPFSKDNYILLGGCFLLIVLAYTLMRIENAEDGFLALYICPVLLGIGYLGTFYALFKRNKTLSE